MRVGTFLTIKPRKLCFWNARSLNFIEWPIIPHKIKNWPSYRPKREGPTGKKNAENYIFLVGFLKCFEKILAGFTSDELKYIFFIIQCPNIYFKDLTKNIKKYHIKYEIKDFFENLPELLENTDLIISRCGAGTINDIIYYKIPSVLIPLPSAKDNHQYENATFLSKQDCGIIMNQDNFDLNKALNFIRLILKDNTKKNQIKEKLNKKIIYDTNKLMLDLIKNEIS